MGVYDESGAYWPTPEEIEEQTQEIRKAWSAEEHAWRAKWAYPRPDFPHWKKDKRRGRTGDADIG